MGAVVDIRQVRVSVDPNRRRRCRRRRRAAVCFSSGNSCGWLIVVYSRLGPAEAAAWGLLGTLWDAVGKYLASL
jgi:hypothetical protein